MCVHTRVYCKYAPGGARYSGTVDHCTRTSGLVRSCTAALHGFKLGFLYKSRNTVGSAVSIGKCVVSTPKRPFISPCSRRNGARRKPSHRGRGAREKTLLISCANVAPTVCKNTFSRCTWFCYTLRAPVPPCKAKSTRFFIALRSRVSQFPVLLRVRGPSL